MRASVPVEDGSRTCVTERTGRTANNTERYTSARHPSAHAGTWAPDDTILFALWPSGLYAVPASGDGRIEAVAKLDRDARDIAFAWPQFLPDGRRFLYQIISLDPARSGAYVGNLDTRESFRLLGGDSAATFAAPRHVLYVENNLLIAAEIDDERFELTGRAIERIDGHELGERRIGITRDGRHSQVGNRLPEMRVAPCAGEKYELGRPWHRDRVR